MKGVWIAVALLTGSIGFGQVRTWVSPTGMDSNPCTRDQPCRNFNAAINAVGSGGEVVALESGGYGPMTITRSVTVVAPDGVHAAIAPTFGNAITIAGGDTDHVVLRNLYLNSHGAATGVSRGPVASLHVERCVISGFAVLGLVFGDATPWARLYISDTTFRNCMTGIEIVGDSQPGIRATLDSVRLLYQRTHAVFVRSAEVTIRESVASRGGFGFTASGLAKIMIENSMATVSDYGFVTSGGVMTMTRCLGSANRIAVSASAGGTIYVSDSIITTNVTGISSDSGGTVSSRGNNTLRANTTNGAFNGSFPSD